MAEEVWDEWDYAYWSSFTLEEYQNQLIMIKDTSRGLTSPVKRRETSNRRTKPVKITDGDGFTIVIRK